MIFDRFFDSFYHYFISIFVNTNLQLSILLASIVLIMVIMRLLNVRKIIQFRNNTSIVMGSWGTRGKSGTERLKAAVFFGYGFNLVSKSSGSEPNLVLGSYLKEPFEIPLYRPYDYANIKEQIKIIKRASELNSPVFLWECMAINPKYAAILQKWMRDDITTIINAYPDHENIQGPRGIDIAHSIAAVMPKKGILVTTEESMLPVLEQQCQMFSSNMTVVSQEEAELITEDVLNIFPYPVYYKNLALILKFFDMLNFNQQEVLTHIKNHVVPDIGCFRIFNPAIRDQRTVRLVNCMSANDYYSTMISLKNIQYNTMTITNKPRLWLMLCVNNRYDRISRSYNFARSLTNELQADKYIVMGTNIDLFMTSIKQYLKIRLDRFLMWNVLESFEEAKTEYQTLVDWLRIPKSNKKYIERFNESLSFLLKKEINEDTLKDDIQQIREIKSAPIEHSETLIQLVLNQYDTMQEYQKTLVFFDTVSSKKKLRNMLIQQITRWYLEKYVIIKNYRAGGDEINSVAFANTPLQLDGYFICMANIKGPGIAVSYSWLLWTEVEIACDALLSPRIEGYESALSFLLKQPFYNAISSPKIGRTIQQLLDKKNMTGSHREKLLQIEKKLIASRIDDITKKRKKLKNKLYVAFLQQIENFLEPGASITRKKQADIIYDHLTDNLISAKEAKIQINRLLMRQKGGWLSRIFM